MMKWEILRMLHSKNSEIPDTLWRLTSPAEVDEVLEKSREIPVLVFKHSTRCPVSAKACRNFLAFLDGRDGQGSLLPALINVVENRGISLDFSEKTGVAHKSPQAVLLVDGKAVWHDSHWNITGDKLEKALEKHP
jgi:bacillithiol system protein YtxJ